MASDLQDMKSTEKKRLGEPLGPSFFRCFVLLTNSLGPLGEAREFDGRQAKTTGGGHESHGGKDAAPWRAEGGNAGLEG